MCKIMYISFSNIYNTEKRGDIFSRRHHMIIFNLTIRYESKDKRIDDRDTLNPEIDGKKFNELMSCANDNFGKECGLDGNMSAFIVGGRTGTIEMILTCNLEEVSIKDCEDWLRKQFLENFSIRNITFVRRKEIDAKELVSVLDKSEKRGFGCYSWFTSSVGFEYFDNRCFMVQESLYDVAVYDKDKIIAQAQTIMADPSVYEELDRIYSDQNEKKYYGNPVHYKITAGNVDAAKDIIELMINALASNNRLLGKRFSYIYNIKESCYNEDNIKDLFKLSKGVSLAIDMSGTDEDHGSYASAYHEVITEFQSLVKANQLYTLCFFVEITDKPGFAKNLVAAVQDDVHLIEIKEGKGDRRQALEYLKVLVSKAKFDASTEELEETLPNQKDYTASEVYATYNKWFSNGLKSKIYQSYRKCEKVEVKVSDPINNPYEQLQKMVGLGNIKCLVDQVINASKVRKMRSDLGMDTHNFTQHMVFTGNPGSAKTTVARLIAEILKKEGTIENGKFVECGRSDLVARYVGWTAKTVTEKFRMARGGVLFIDEAYSLVDDSNSFGAEAINTIVQEMENHRDDVMVILAGYPDKMETLLAQNEGLRSRIAFHLDFPDYNPEELMQILELMAKQKGYRLNSSIKTKCSKIFDAACHNKEFGNGRFVRNLLEQAILRQSDRIIRTNKNRKVDRKALSTLMSVDFDVNIAEKYQKVEKVIGF